MWVWHASHSPPSRGSKLDYTPSLRLTSPPCCPGPRAPPLPASPAPLGTWWPASPSAPSSRVGARLGRRWDLCFLPFSSAFPILSPPSNLAVTRGSPDSSEPARAGHVVGDRIRPAVEEKRAPAAECCSGLLDGPPCQAGCDSAAGKRIAGHLIFFRVRRCPSEAVGRRRRGDTGGCRVAGLRLRDPPAATSAGGLVPPRQSEQHSQAPSGSSSSMGKVLPGP